MSVDNQPRDISRRSIAKGAAWAAPAVGSVALAASAPAAAASPCGTQEAANPANWSSRIVVTSGCLFSFLGIAGSYGWQICNEPVYTPPSGGAPGCEIPPPTFTPTVIPRGTRFREKIYVNVPNPGFLNANDELAALSLDGYGLWLSATGIAGPLFESFDRPLLWQPRTPGLGLPDHAVETIDGVRSVVRYRDITITEALSPGECVSYGYMLGTGTFGTVKHSLEVLPFDVDYAKRRATLNIGLLGGCNDTTDPAA